jgi:hypothetical protein
LKHGKEVDIEMVDKTYIAFQGGTRRGDAQFNDARPESGQKVERIYFMSSMKTRQGLCGESGHEKGRAKLSGVDRAI